MNHKCLELSFTGDILLKRMLKLPGDLTIVWHNFILLLLPVCAVKVFTSEKKVTVKKVFVTIIHGHKIFSSRSGTREVFLVRA